MFGWVLCKLGLHSWHHWATDHIGGDDHITHKSHFDCKRTNCGAYRVVEHTLYRDGKEKITVSTTEYVNEKLRREDAS